MSHLRHNLIVLLISVFCLGLFDGIMQSSFNNYLNDVFRLSATGRSWLEFPREAPGILTMFVIGTLLMIAVNKQAALAAFMSGLGALGLGFFIRIDNTPVFPLLIIWMISWSMGDHLFMPLKDTLSLSVARENREGHRLGQIDGMRMLSNIIGSSIVWLLMGKHLTSFLPKIGYKSVFLLACIAAILASISLLFMKSSKQSQLGKRFVYRREYRLYYILNMLFGGRKQLFLTFGPWVLITKFGATPSYIAGLLMLAGIIGIVFRPLLGYLVDRLGERFTMKADAIILLFICLGYALGERLLGRSNALYLLSACYVTDNLFFAMRIARTTYLNKILVNKHDLTPTLATGVAVDHIGSMTLPILGGYIWKAFDYQMVFYLASIIAFAYYIAALFIPDKKDIRQTST